MSIDQRRHIRFSLDIPATRYTKYNEAVETVLNQISIGGCLLEWDESVYVGDEFRLLVELPNENFLPLQCKALYRFEDGGIGAITRFEQELLTKVITLALERQGLPLQVDPFALPKKSILAPAASAPPQITDERRKREEILEDILSFSDMP